MSQLIYVTLNIKNVILWLKSRHRDSFVLLVNSIVNNAPLHSSPHINQTLPHIIHIWQFCPVVSLLNYATRSCSQLD